MKSLKNFLPQNASDWQQRSKRAMNEPNQNLSREHIRELWRRMTDIFGAQWNSQHGDIDHDDTWLRGLSGLMPDDLAFGLHACVDMKPDAAGNIWCPALPMFKSMCKGTTPAAMHEEYKALPSPSLSKEEKLKHIADIRALLK